MELLQLRYFREVANQQSVTRAAEALHIAQPSLSKTISRLEEQLGTPLFERKGKRIQLNEFGKCFLVRVERCLDELENGIKEVQDLARLAEQTISIGTATAKMLPDLMKAYLIQNNDVKVRLLQVTEHAELLRQLEQGKIDISISSLPLQKKGICCQKLLQEQICLIVPPTHKLAARKEVFLKELENETFVFYTTECGLGETVKQFCEQADFKPNISCECATPEVTCGLVEAGLGLAFLPEYISAMDYTKKVSWLPVKEPEMQRTIWASWNEERYLTKAACGFLQFLFEYFDYEQCPLPQPCSPQVCPSP